VETQPHGGPLVALTLNQWRGQPPDLPSSTLAWVPHQPQGWEPLCGFYRRSVQVSLQSFQAEGGRSFQAWLDQVPVQAMEFTSPSPLATMLWNCNDPTQCNP
jgi:molybdopterin-guanine dinucleotide biosynthesis protein A